MNTYRGEQNLSKATQTRHAVSTAATRNDCKLCKATDKQKTQASGCQVPGHQSVCTRVLSHPPQPAARSSSAQSAAKNSTELNSQNNMRLSSDLQVEQDKDMRTRRWKRGHREASVSPPDSCERRSASDHDESERPLHKESMQTVTHFRSASWGRFWMHAVECLQAAFLSARSSRAYGSPARTIIAQAQYRVCEGEQLLVYGTKLTKQHTCFIFCCDQVQRKRNISQESNYDWHHI